MDANNHMIAWILFWIFVIYFNHRQIKQAKGLNNSTDKKLIYWLQPILLIGILIRTVYLFYPFGVFCDEAINGYDSWCLANYGVDQHLAPYPVYLKSWGTGQSALYAYLAAPFIKIFGLSTPIHRMPMAMMSSISILFFYRTFSKTQKNVLLTFILTIFLLINPWHIMKSRWALDCNICPDLILIGICFIILAYHILPSRKQTIYYVLGFAFLAISAYSYGVSWLLLPILCIGLFIYLLKIKKISFVQLSLSILTIAILTIPLILFAFNLFFDGEQYQLGPITITGMEAKRYEDTTLLQDGSFLQNLQKNIHDAGRLLIIGTDGVLWNSIRLWGQFYNILGISFIIYYFIINIKNKQFSSTDIIFIIWLIACLPIVIFVSPNVNHWNLLWFPLIYFCGRGIYMAITQFAKMRYVVAAVFLLSFSLFLYEYFDYYRPQNKGKLWSHPGFTPGVEEPVRFVKQGNFDKIYYSGTSHSTSVSDAPVFLFYHPEDPHLVVYKNENYDLLSCDNNYFYLPEEIVPMPQTAYVISKDYIEDIDYTGFNVKDFDQYIVLWNE